MEINEKWKFLTLRLPARKLRVYYVSKCYLETSVSLIIKIAVTLLVWKNFSSFGVRFITTAIKFWPFFRCFVSWSHQSWGEALFMRKIKKTNVDENWQKNRLLFLPFMDCFLLLMRKRSYIKNLKNIMELKEFCSIFSQYLSWTLNPGIKQF